MSGLGFELNTSQTLSITPQLQQAIKLLTLSTTELQAQIDQMLAENPMLETEESDFETNKFETPVSSRISAGAGVSGRSNQYGDMTFDHPDQDHNPLHTELHFQRQLSRLSPEEDLIAMCIIDEIDERGYLGCSDEVLTEIIQDQAVDFLGRGYHPAPEQIESVLLTVQSFEPLGVASRSLDECLLKQVDHALAKPHADAAKLELARTIISDHLGLVAKEAYGKIKRATKTQVDALSGAIDLIKSLNPTPASEVKTPNLDYVIPDVIVERGARGGWRVMLNETTRPKVRLNDTYVGLIKRADDSDDNQYLREHLQDARAFLAGIRSREDTLLRVSQAIIDVQSEFLTQGDIAMQPLVLQQVADAIEMHESTVSRVTTNKYILTPQGTFELKYFFSTPVKMQNGEYCAAKAIRALITEIVAGESSLKPYSDNQIAAILQDRGILVARRTVSKYRELLRIPTSSERRRGR